jgi:hypothetical protein
VPVPSFDDDGNNDNNNNAGCALLEFSGQRRQWRVHVCKQLLFLRTQQPEYVLLVQELDVSV